MPFLFTTTSCSAVQWEEERGSTSIWYVHGLCACVVFDTILDYLLRLESYLRTTCRFIIRTSLRALKRSFMVRSDVPSYLQRDRVLFPDLASASSRVLVSGLLCKSCAKALWISRLGTCCRVFFRVLEVRRRFGSFRGTDLTCIREC